MQLNMSSVKWLPFCPGLNVLISAGCPVFTGQYHAVVADSMECSSTTSSSSSTFHQGIHQSVFMSAMVTSPSKDLPLCWDQHSKLLPGVEQYKARDVADWTTVDVADFVSTLPGCRELGGVFKEQVRRKQSIIYGIVLIEAVDCGVFPYCFNDEFDICADLSSRFK